MKYLSVLLIVLFVHSGCHNCSKDYETEELSIYDAFYYFPYSQGDTICLLHNHSDTLSFIAGEKSKTYDDRSWIPEADGKPCPSYFHTQHIKQDLVSSVESITINSYVDENKMFIHQCSPCSWNYKIATGKWQFESGYPEYIKDSIAVNHIIYKNVRYMTGGTLSKDTIYFSDKGIIRIVYSSEVYDRVGN